jgi:hypothetical protein
LSELRTWLWRVVAIAGVSSAFGSLLWRYYLYVVSPAEPVGDHTVAQIEHGQLFFVRVWEGNLIGILAVSGVAIILLVCWIDWADRKKFGRLKRYSPLPDWRGRPKADRRDIITYEFGYFVAAWIVLVSAAIATGGDIPFGGLRG